MKFVEVLKSILKFLTLYNGLLGVFIAVLALWFTISSSRKQDEYNTKLYNSVDSLRLLTSKMLERQINSERSQLMPKDFRLTLKPNAQDDTFLYPLLKFSIMNYGHSPGNIDSLEFMMYSASSDFVYTSKSKEGITLLKNTQIPLSFCYPVFKSEKTLSYVYVKCIWIDNLTKEMDSVEVMQSFTYKSNNTFLVSQLSDKKRSEILERISEYKLIEIDAQYSNKFYPEGVAYTLEKKK